MRVLLVIYDNDAYVHWFPQGMGYVAAVLEKEGYEVEIYNQDIHHYPEAHLKEKLDKERYDVVGLSVIGGYYQYHKLLKISEAINCSSQRPTYIIGGHGPSPEPEYFLKKSGADIAVIGEGEETIVELFRALASKSSLKNIKGIAYREEAKVTVNPRRELIQDIDTIPEPAYHLFPINNYRLLRLAHIKSSDFAMPILSGRGCTFTCNFCYRLDEGFRARSSEAIIEEIRRLQRNYRINFITFGDELLMSSKKRTIQLCEDMIKANLNIKWTCNGRLNYATPEVLSVMKRAGCVLINYGIEAYDNKILKVMNKALTTDMIDKGISETLKLGISPGLNIIWGNIGEDRETLDKGVEFLIRHDDGAQLRTIRPVTPYPGSPLYYHAIKEGLLKNAEDFYENKHTNSDLLAINFTTLTDDEFYEALASANNRLLDNYYERKRVLMKKQVDDLYLKRDASFRGFRHT